LLPFLAYWVGWEFDYSWELPQQRRLIRRAVELYRWRGTRKGLRLYLHLYTGLPLDEDISNENDKHISITEPFGHGFILNDAELGNAVLGGGRAYHFIVRLRPDSPNTIHEALIRRIIEQEKPAFCTYELSIENP
jgi:Phage tail protein (Tail_P2_I)